MLFSDKTGVVVLYRDSTRSPKRTTRTTLLREADLEARVLPRPLCKAHVHVADGSVLRFLFSAKSQNHVSSSLAGVITVGVTRDEGTVGSKLLFAMSFDAVRLALCGCLPRGLSQRQEYEQ